MLGEFARLGWEQPVRVAPGYYTSECWVFGGLRVKIGFHFRPQTETGRLRELEFFDNGEKDICRSYELFHASLLRVFGPPTSTCRGDLGHAMPACEWRLGRVSIRHFTIDRFGPEEHLRFRQVVGLSNTRVISTLVISILMLLLYAWFCL